MALKFGALALLMVRADVVVTSQLDLSLVVHPPQKNPGSAPALMKTKLYFDISHWEIRLKKVTRLKRERTRVTKSLGLVLVLAFDWLKWWREFSRLITQRRTAKTKQPRLVFSIPN